MTACAQVVVKDRSIFETTDAERVCVKQQPQRDRDTTFFFTILIITDYSYCYRFYYFTSIIVEWQPAWGK